MIELPDPPARHPMERLAIDEMPEWASLASHAKAIAATDLADLFARDPDRATAMTFRVGSMVVDVSKNLVTDETVAALAALAERAGVTELRDAMFAGGAVNTSEHRPALHTALRAVPGSVIVVDGTDVVPGIASERARVADAARAIRAGRWLGATGQPMAHVVNVGIGGNDLGPQLAHHALVDHCDAGLSFDFLSNLDGSDLVDVLRDKDPSRTLFVVSSKSFGTLETMLNARAARAWVVDHLGAGAVARHFVAVTGDAPRGVAFGIPEDRRFDVPTWVGGRWSFPSAVGFALMVAIGPERFDEVLAGLRTVDEHFRREPLGTNVPMLLGMIGVWYHTFLGAQTMAVLPYSSRLARLPTYVQQLDMESNGKSVDRHGNRLSYATGPVVWGGVGTNGQHAYHQLLHQGTRLVPADFIGVCRPEHDLDEHHDWLMANLFAQTEALAFGTDGAEVDPHVRHEGNRPSTTILLPELTPRTFGELIALYEHKTVVQGAIWQIDSFDQWGVELGKERCGTMKRAIDRGEAPTAFDASTKQLISTYLRLRRQITSR